MSELLWVDTASGTWGEVDSDAGRLLLVRADELETALRITGSRIETASDGEITEAADEVGILPGPGLSLEALGQLIRIALPDAQFEQDNDGQWIIYTGLAAE